MMLVDSSIPFLKIFKLLDLKLATFVNKQAKVLLDQFPVIRCISRRLTGNNDMTAMFLCLFDSYGILLAISTVIMLANTVFPLD